MHPGLATAEIGGQRVAIAGVSQCHVCRSPLRERIERELVEGKPATVIARGLPRGVHLSLRNVLEHKRRGHLPADHERVRAVADLAARGLRDVAELNVTHAATEIALAREVVRVVHERMMSGEIAPSMRDGVAFARILDAHDRVDRTFERKTFQKAFRAILKHVNQAVDAGTWSRITDAIMSDPATLPLHMVGPTNWPRGAGPMRVGFPRQPKRAMNRR